MALVVKDRVQESSTTTGTGTLTLGGALTGFQSFSSAIGNGNTTYYAITLNGEWEVGEGTVGAGTLARNTVLESSNGGSLVNFSVGTKNVFCTYPAERSLTTDAIDSTVQGYDVNTAKLNEDQNWSGSQRGVIVTDNDLSFDLNASNNFTCTPTATGALTFTNHTAGQSGYVLLINTSGYAITAAATTKVNLSFLATVSTAGTYLISYYDNGTNAYCTTSGALS